MDQSDDGQSNIALIKSRETDFLINPTLAVSGKVSLCRDKARIMTAPPFYAVL